MVLTRKEINAIKREVQKDFARRRSEVEKKIIRALSKNSSLKSKRRIK